MSFDERARYGQRYFQPLPGHGLSIGSRRWDCESGRAVVTTGMTWAAFILILVMTIAASKFARHFLALLAMVASIAALVWFLVRPPDRQLDRVTDGSGSRAGLTLRPVP